VIALQKGECVAVFPEGTISEDLEPMRGKSGTARLAQESGVAVVPVGLWGTHRMLTKGRRPHLSWGVAQVAVVGAPVHVAEGERVRDATLRIMDAITECVARARAIYPQRPAAGDDAWWWRDPETATAHRRPA
jgi:1-acyl-sn-glycerol-3-phosphate acyltransferase